MVRISIGGPIWACKRLVLTVGQETLATSDEVCYVFNFLKTFPCPWLPSRTVKFHSRASTTMYGIVQCSISNTIRIQTLSARKARAEVSFDLKLWSAPCSSALVIRLTIALNLISIEMSSERLPQEARHNVVDMTTTANTTYTRTDASLHWLS